MKNLLFILSFLFVSEISYCDIIPDNSHQVNKCVQITYNDDFPEYCLIAYITGPGVSHFRTYKIDSKTCLEKGYKFNTLSIFAIKKDYLDKINLDTTDLLKDKNALKSNINIDCYGGYVSNDNPIYSIEEYYEIVGITDTSVILNKYKELKSFINGQPALIKTNGYKAGISQIDSVENLENSNSNLNWMYSSTYLISFFKALLFTILIETMVLFLIFKTSLKKIPIKNGVLVLTGILTSFATLTYVWFVLPIIIKPTLPYMIISELSVVFVESILIWRLLTIDLKKAVVISFICNLTSFLFGLLMNMI